MDSKNQLEPNKIIDYITILVPPAIDSTHLPSTEVETNPDDESNQGSDIAGGNDPTQISIPMISALMEQAATKDEQLIASKGLPCVFNEVTQRYSLAPTAQLALDINIAYMNKPVPTLKLAASKLWANRKAAADARDAAMAADNNQSAEQDAIAHEVMQESAAKEATNGSSADASSTSLLSNLSLSTAYEEFVSRIAARTAAARELFGNNFSSSSTVTYITPKPVVLPPPNLTRTELEELMKKIGEKKEDK